MSDSGDMGEEAPAAGGQKSNLARIRDNQRRSRARRKEYLQDLEMRYRTCEQIGVGASAEIQGAARRVVEENKRLRQLLKNMGISDADIDGMPADRPENPQYPTAASALEAMLGVRKTCGPGNDCKSSTSSRPQSTTPAMQPQHARFQMTQTPTLAPMPPAPVHDTHIHFSSPHSTVSHSTPNPNENHFLSPQPLPGPAMMSPIRQQPQPGSVQPYVDEVTWQDPYNTNDPSGIGNASSCYVAAGAIRTIRPDFEMHELGCGDGRDCNVPNQEIFEMMDRYSERGP